jgi:hypothetical protein
MALLYHLLNIIQDLALSPELVPKPRHFGIAGAKAFAFPSTNTNHPAAQFFFKKKL